MVFDDWSIRYMKKMCLDWDRHPLVSIGVDLEGVDGIFLLIVRW